MAVELIWVILCSSPLSLALDESIKMTMPYEFLNLVLKLDVFFYVMAMTLIVQTILVQAFQVKGVLSFLAFRSFSFISINTFALGTFKEM